MQRRSHTAPARPTPASIEAEVITNIRGQPLGPGTVADLALPGTFVARIAGRVIQTWYHERFRIVVDDRGGQKTPESTAPASGTPAGIPTIHVQCPTPPISADSPAVPPPARNYKAPLTHSDASQFPYEAPSVRAKPPLPGLARLVATTLAGDGLLRCAAAGLAMVRAARPGIGSSEALDMLRIAGLPTDLLKYFAPSGWPERGESSTIEWLAQQLSTTELEKLRSPLAKVPFRFQATAPGFAALPDSGQTKPDWLRIQLTRGGYYAGKGDGGSLDLMRQLLDSTDARLLVQLEERDLPGLLSVMGDWPQVSPQRVTLVVQDLPLSQWAQDNAKPGLLADNAPCTLVPRFASRGEDSSQLVIGDSCVVAALDAAGHRAVQSPLLFQGGNLLTVYEPASGQRTLLVGEAEVWRNQALGLSNEQVLGAFQAEMGVDRCVVLPGAAIHLDYEVSVRSQKDGVVALVNDTRPAVRMVLHLGIDRLTEVKLLDSAAAALAKEHINTENATELSPLLKPVLEARSAGPGQFPLSLADLFSEGPSDSGVGNFLRFLAALDMFVALSARAVARIKDPYYVAYLLACARQERDRRSLRETLKSLGWQVIPVPSFSMGDRSVTAINGVHTAGKYLMPSYGGFYSSLDRAAADAAVAALGPEVQIVPILCGESQRRDGAVHCSTSVLRGVPVPF